MVKYDKRIVVRHGEKCAVQYAQYDNGRLAVQLICLEGEIPGETMSTPSVNMVDEPTPPPGHTFFKTWSENEGLLELLQAAGIVQPTKVRVPAGHCVATLVQVTPQYTENDEPPGIA